MSTRLRTMPKDLATARQELAPASFDSERQRLKVRDASKASKKWGKSGRWKRLRLKVLDDKLWTCEKTGVKLVEGNKAPNSAVVDHIIPHREDPALFWDEKNLQVVSKSYHDKAKQSQESVTPLWWL